jgi:hypothetical protein
MYRSLIRHCPDFHLFIFAFDDKCFRILNKMKPANTTIISLAEFEDEKLLKIKESRTMEEYCWTCTASVILYTLKKFTLESCTYLDADLFFYDSPEHLLAEMPENKSVLITEHRFSKNYSSYSNFCGIFCVQFMTFKNDRNGIKVLEWWRDACLRWCYARYENGKFGDQMYLDHWPYQFLGVYILRHTGGGVGPWNARRYTFYQENGFITGIEKETNLKFNLIFYHFSGVKLSKNDTGPAQQGKAERLSMLPVPGELKLLLYKQYINTLNEINSEIETSAVF